MRVSLIEQVSNYKGVGTRPGIPEGHGFRKSISVDGYFKAIAKIAVSKAKLFDAP